jgi:2-polyprenyl-3-methyl-5-hydroxy-6-metoxy-1,4-benzoquinol methylase
MNHICPLCFAKSEVYGNPAYHTVNSVAGISSINYISKSYSLVKCSNCNLIFKSPIPDEETLSQLYRQSGQDIGNTDKCLAIDQNGIKIRRFDEIEKLAEKLCKGKKVLDIGCNDGAMLFSWSNQWDKHGLEYSQTYSKVAEMRGLKIIGSGIHNCKNNFESYFDVITLVDVAEHIPNPSDFFKDILSLIKNDGIVLILTATTDYWFWKLIKSGYWYESFPEHIIFWSRKTFDFLANQNNAQVIYDKRVSHYKNRKTRLNYLFQLAKNTLFLGVQIIAKKFNSQYGILMRGYPSFTEASDHILVVLQKS